MFNVGDVVTGNERAWYGITDKYSLCIVTKVDSNTMFHLKLLGHRYGTNLTNPGYGSEYGYKVAQEYFTATTVEEFVALHPDYHYVDDINETVQSILKNEPNKEETTMETVMNKAVATVLTEEEIKELRVEIIDLLKKYGYNPTERAVNKIINEWVANKGWMIEMFKKHPNYNGRFQIVFDADYERTLDRNVVNKFRRYLSDVSANLFRKEARIGCFTYRELDVICSKLGSIKSRIEDLRYAGAKTIVVDGKTEKEIGAEYDYFYKKREAFKRHPNVYISGGNAFDNEAYKIYSNMHNVIAEIYRTKEHLATEEFVKVINENFPETKAVVGQKVSRIITKLCTKLGITNDAEWNREFAKYSDAINPLTIKRHTILSIHPVDYLTMSFGNSWASCHTIDKRNLRGMPDDYNGCYSGGTLSYMLDTSSFVFYTVDEKYTGTLFELQDKINRNMFHMGEDKLVQGRVYPQANDGENGLYKQIREIAQKVVADCLGVSNMWKNVKGTDECYKTITSRGVHYTDYTSFSSCNVSYLKRDKAETDTEEDDIFNNVKIVVGHDPICPSCGCEHDWTECIECSDCYDDGCHHCENCGDTYDEDDMYYIDGDWYCSDCCFYCDYHERYEAGESDYYVDGYGHICEDAYENGDFASCERCGDVFWTEHGCAIETEDGSWFCCEDCARREGYVEIDGKWYDEDETVTCEHCGELILEDDALETEDGTWFCDAECAAEGDYVEVRGEWYPTDEVHTCPICGDVVHDDYWNEDHECCDDCAENIDEEE